MGRLFLTELWKQIKNRKNWIICITIIIATSGWLLWQNRAEGHKTNVPYSVCQEMSERIKRQTALLSEEDTEIKKAYERQKDLYDSQARKWKNGDWEEALKLQNQLDEDALNGYPQIYSEAEESTPVSIQERETQIAVREYLLKKTIPPLYHGDFNGWYGLYIALKELWPFLLPLVVVAFTADSVSGERDEGSLRLWMQQPFKRWKILAVKLLTGCTLSMIMLAVSAFIVFAGGCIFYGSGSVLYPVRATGSCWGQILMAGEEYTAVGTFIFQDIVLSIVIVFFFGSFGIFISVLAADGLSGLGGGFFFSLLVIFGADFLKNIEILQVVFPFFADAASVLSGEWVFSSMIHGILLFLWIIVCLAAIRIFKN